MPRKKKPIPMSWSDIRSINFTDKRWQSINQDIQLPDEARLLIERTVSLYPFHKHNHQGYPTPGATRKELRAAHEAARRLHAVLKKMTESAGYALIDSTETPHGQHPKEIWAERLQHLEKIVSAFPAAIKYIEKKRKKPGPDSSALDFLVEQLDGILRRYKKLRLQRSKGSVSYVIAVTAVLADPDISPDVIEASIRRLIRKRSDKSL